MRNFKIFNLVTALALTSVFSILSCSKEDSKTVNYESIKLEARNLTEPLSKVWNYAYSNYTMPELCACNCAAAQIAQTTINSQLSTVSIYNGLAPLNYNCDLLLTRLSITCRLTDAQKFQFVDSVATQLIQKGILNSTEKNVLNSLLTKIRTDVMNINFQDYYNQLNLIGASNSPSGLRYPTLIVQNCENAFQYFDNVTPPTGTTEPQFIVNKLLGGWASASIGLLWDIYDNGGGGGPDAWRNLGRNFVGGCVTSL